MVNCMHSKSAICSFCAKTIQQEITKWEIYYFNVLPRLRKAGLQLFYKFRIQNPCAEIVLNDIGFSKPRN
jgi:hypothetical protein